MFIHFDANDEEDHRSLTLRLRENYFSSNSSAPNALIARFRCRCA